MQYSKYLMLLVSLPRNEHNAIMIVPKLYICMDNVSRYRVQSIFIQVCSPGDLI